MNKKTWSNPEVLNLGLDKTQGGGSDLKKHDGIIYQYEIKPGLYIPVEGYNS